MVKIIRKQRFESCPCCDKSHDLKLQENTAIVKIKGVAVKYQEQTYYCKNTDTYFTSGRMEDENLKRARDAYQKITDGDN